MPKVYEFGAAKLPYDNPAVDKPKLIAANADKMLALGWDYKGFYEVQGLITVFYQREVIAEPVQTTLITPPA